MLRHLSNFHCVLTVSNCSMVSRRIGKGEPAIGLPRWVHLEGFSPSHLKTQQMKAPPQVFPVAAYWLPSSNPPVSPNPKSSRTLK